MTTMYFAICEASVMTETFKNWDWYTRPVNFLVSFVSVNQWRKCSANWKVGKTMLDSGAFSAMTTGKQIDIDALSKEAKNGGWDEVVSLDVIGDPHASYYNTMLMKGVHGLSTFPTFHYGEPWELLQRYKEDFGDRIGLGGLWGGGLAHKAKIRWMEQCFARGYPARFHGFGVSKEEVMMAVPFYSVDCSSWFSGLRFGHKKPSVGRDAYPGVPIPRFSEVGSSAYNFSYQILFYLEREKRVQERWKNELAWTRKETV